MQQLTQAMTEMRADSVQQQQQASKEREERVAAQAELAALQHSFAALEARFADVDAHSRQQTEDLQSVVDSLQAQANDTHRLAEAASSDAAFAEQTVRTVNLRADEQGQRLQRADEQLGAVREAIQGCASAANQEATAAVVAGMRAQLTQVATLADKLRRDVPEQLQAQAELLEKLRRVAARHDVQLRALTQELLDAEAGSGRHGQLGKRLDALQLSFKRWQAELSGLPWESAEPLAPAPALPWRGDCLGPLLSAAPLHGSHGPHHGSSRAWEGQLHELTATISSYAATPQGVVASHSGGGGEGGGSSGGGGGSSGGDRTGTAIHSDLMAAAPRASSSIEAALSPMAVVASAQRSGGRMPPPVAVEVAAAPTSVLPPSAPHPSAAPPPSAIENDAARKRSCATASQGREPATASSGWHPASASQGRHPASAIPGRQPATGIHWHPAAGIQPLQSPPASSAIDELHWLDSSDVEVARFRRPQPRPLISDGAAPS